MQFQRIAICLDSNYESQAITLLTQIRNHEMDFSSKYFFEVVTIPEEKLKNLEAFLQQNKVRYQISYFDVGLSDTALHNSLYPKATFLKLFLGLIQESQDLKFSSNLIYLDLDLLIQGGLPSLVEIAQQPMEDTVCRAVVEPWNHKHLAAIQKIDAYFNSGVLILNPEAWNRLDLTNVALNRLKEHGVTLYADQDYFNLLLADTNLFEPLPKNFNLMPPLPLGFIRGTSIIHFAGAQKPWNAFGWHWSYISWRKFHSVNFSHIQFSGRSIYRELMVVIHDLSYRFILQVYLHTIKKLRANKESNKPAK